MLIYCTASKYKDQLSCKWQSLCWHWHYRRCGERIAGYVS